MPTVHVFEGDALVVLSALPSNSIDSIITDPPYGLTSRFAIKNSRFPGHQGKRRGFLGHKWDASLPSAEVWKEAIRVLKPGGFLIAFGGTRTYHRLASAIETAGFVIRDMLDWVHTQGMPKWFDLEREIAKLAPERAGNWRGWQLNLKPAHEPIVLAQKPISEVTFAANVLRWGVGALNVEACRTPFLDDNDRQRFVRNFSGASDRFSSSGYNGSIGGGRQPSERGRYPADVVTGDSTALGPGGHIYFVGGSGSNVARARKASQIERSHGGAVENNHPTVKPLILMRWLVRLVTPPGGVVLDPFAGSGTTGIAALAEGCGAILVDKEPEYTAMARQRVAAVGKPSRRSENLHEASLQ